MHAQTVRLLPLLRAAFAGIAVRASPATHQPTLALLREAGAVVEHEAPDDQGGYATLGRTRRGAVRSALGLGTPHILFCDWDRMLHWAERYPGELRGVLGALLEHDLTVIGRTPRAFASHPRLQRETETPINHVYRLVSGHDWDVTAATRGLSRRAAEAILADCPDEAISTDVSWPLHLQRAGGYSLGYVATEGMEFETADRYPAEVAAAGGIEAWLARLDADPHAWLHRLRLAQVEVEAALRYVMTPGQRR